MAVGDVVNGISPFNTLIDFQPASGVSVCITSVHVSTLVGGQLYDGTLTSLSQSMRNDTGLGGTVGMKVFITNSIYLRIPAIASWSSAYTGIQIK